MRPKGAIGTNQQTAGHRMIAPKCSANFLYNPAVRRPPQKARPTVIQQSDTAIENVSLNIIKLKYEKHGLKSIEINNYISVI